MESMSSSNSVMTQPVSSPERRPLLHSPVITPSLRERFALACINPRHLCLPSKAAVLILVWSALVGAVYTLVIDFSIAIGVYGKKFKLNGHKYHLNVFLNVFVPYACVALVLLVYPFSGLVADVCCGRYKTVIASMSTILCSIGCFAFTGILLMICIDHDIPNHLRTFGEYLLILVVVMAFLMFIIGQAGFQANFIQLGLDQLHEASSEYLGLFVHWAIWAGNIATPFLHLIFAAYACTQSDRLLYGVFSLPCLLFILLSLIVSLSCWKNHWFYSEPGQHNPYKTVIKVLHFVRKHKYPLRRSAFTYHDNEMPTRMDFAKERYGGPFTTEQVEDVKSFLRILVILAALGPIFLLEVPASYFIFASFTLHTGQGPEFKEKNCTARWLVLESGNLGQLFTVVTFPIYIWLIFSFLRRCIPKIFTRLLVGGLLLLIGVLSMFATDLLGHFLLKVSDTDLPSYSPHGKASYCMFKIDVTSKYVKALHLHWGFHIIPNLLIGFSPVLITTTAFEFISAQSPHSMKGLLVGVFFAIKGLFQLSSAILLLPFSLPHFWETGQYSSSPRAINCGFGYFFIVCGLALIGLIVFAIVAKYYQYRERDDPPYNQAVVEEVFGRTVGHNTYQIFSPDYDNQNDMQYTVSFPISSGIQQT